LFEHDLFRKTGTHFSGSCSGARTVSAGDPIIKAMPAGIILQQRFPHGEERILRVSNHGARDHSRSRRIAAALRDAHKSAPQDEVWPGRLTPEFVIGRDGIVTGENRTAR
jgi:hypothetical protein